MSKDSRFTKPPEKKPNPLEEARKARTVENMAANRSTPASKGLTS